MSVFRRARLIPVLHLLVLGLLVSGLLIKPVLAAACDIDDVRQALAGEHRPAMQAPEAAAGADCCLAQNCSECCGYGAALVPPSGEAMAAQVNASPLPRLSMRFEPPAYPVGFRPPIAG